MRLGIDSRMIDWSGIGRYTQNLIVGIEEFGAEIKPILFCNRDNAHKLPGHIVSERLYINTPVLSLAAPFRLANKLNNSKIELFHSPHYAVPFGKTSFPIIVTIHDLIPLIIKQTMPNLLHRRYYYLLNSLACHKAEKIIVPSFSTKKDVLNLFKVPETKVEVVYCVQDPIFKKISKRQLDNVKDKFAIKDGYIFALGNQKPNKGIEFLIEAYHKLVTQRSFKYKLILAGVPSKRFRRIVNLISKYGLESFVRFTGKVTDDELVALYNGASVFIFPSLYEGFGLPPLEAMSCEVPVIASNRSSVPEVVGDAALLINPYDVNELTNAITRVIEDTNLKVDLIARGLKRTANFSLEKFTRETIAVYNRTPMA